MSARISRGTSPLDRLRAHYDEVDAICPECGFEDLDGAWTAGAAGRRVEYVRECPSCGATRRRTVRFRRPSTSP
jgi:predicted RNA-binding Zn-ribbon protein involved in translation (DUF1610 family)